MYFSNMWFGLIVISVFWRISHGETVYMCDSKIYCQGPILEAVNRLHLFNDSKDFVDMPLVKSPNETLKAFEKRFPDHAKIKKADLQKFLNEYFDEPGKELVGCNSTDWKKWPKSFDNIKDNNYRKWAQDLHGIWLKLCRNIEPSHLRDFDRNSLIYVPHSFIALGGRFREYYYSDSFWIIKGLLVSEMYETVKGIIRNFSYLIQKYGFVPNGGRMYYLKRSQPPFFIPMVYAYYQDTNDLDFLKEMVPYMIKEIDFWQKKRSVTLHYKGENHTIYQYRTTSNTPRPEGYYQDVKLASTLNTKEEQANLYQNIASTAESGWDFSSRWLTDPHNLATNHIIDMAPVDLNAYICWNLDIIRYTFMTLGNHSAAKEYEDRRLKFQKTFEAIFYNHTAGAYFDFELKSQQHVARYYVSTAIPLFTECYDNLGTQRAEHIYKYLMNIGAFNFPSGIPTSLIETSEQWDFANSWAPENHMVIEGLRKSDNAEMQEKAFEIAEKWLRTNYLVYKKTSHMFEKYNVTDTTYQPGGGGEYEVQTGFGWTNGVVLDLLRTYGSRLKAPNVASTATNSSSTNTSTVSF